MFRTDAVTAAGVLPAAAPAGSPGYFTNGNPATSTPSTIVDQDWLNSVQEELVAIATSLGAALSKTARNQVLVAIQQMIQQHGSNFVADTGAANAYVGNFTPAIAAYVNGMQLRLFVANANSGASTFKADALAAKNVLRLDGTALAAGDIPANSFATFTYRLSNDSWYLSSTPQNFAAVTVQQQTGNYITAGGTANAITATFVPAVGAHVAGMPLRVKIATTSTGATTINPGPGAVAVVDAQGQALIGGELVAGAIVEFKYDGTSYQHNQSSGRLIKREVFTASGTYTKDARARKVIVTVQAPGGGGGGISTGGSFAGAAGGSAGSYGEIELIASALSGTVAVTVGTGGAGGSLTGPTNGSNGSAASSFGAHLSCAAGLGGTAMANGTLTASVAGGASPALPGTGDVKVVGQAGGFGSRENWSASAVGAVPGDGGSSFLGRGGKTGLSTGGAVAGADGTGYGSGGGGAVANVANGAAGGAGMPGIVIVETYA